MKDGKDELEFNKKNREDYEDLMDKSSTQLDGYWDKSNFFIKILLLVLFVIIIVGSYFIISSYLGS